MKIVAIAFLAFGILCQARHIHPGNFVDNINNDDSDMSIDVIRNMKPSGFVPLNNVLYFKSYEPCEDGFKRDLLGVCREVWD